MLDELDKELEKRGHKFARYADDCNIYIQSERAGRRVMASLTQFLEQKLRLKVNAAKSAVALVDQRKFLGYRLQKERKLSVAPESLQRLKDKVRERTKRNKSLSLESIIAWMAELFSIIQFQKRIYIDRLMDSPQTPLLPIKATKERAFYHPMANESRHQRARSSTNRVIRQRMVVSG